MIYDVEFSLDAAAELLRIAEVIGSAMSVLRAAEAIRGQLENDPAEKGEFLSEGLYYIDEQPLRAFFLIDVESIPVRQLGEMPRSSNQGTSPELCHMALNRISDSLDVRSCGRLAISRRRRLRSLRRV